MGLFQTLKSFNRFAPFKPFNSIQVGSTFIGSMEDKLDWNFTFEDSRGVEGQDRLEVQLATSSLMWIPSRLLRKTHMLRCSLIASHLVLLSSLQEVFSATC
jgi:hypothetical protein